MTPHMTTTTLTVNRQILAEGTSGLKSVELFEYLHLLTTKTLTHKTRIVKPHKFLTIK